MLCWPSLSFRAVSLPFISKAPAVIPHHQTCPYLGAGVRGSRIAYHRRPVLVVSAAAAEVASWSIRERFNGNRPEKGVGAE